jgi:Transcriptional Coactivator p15 (PC4)
MTDRALTEPIEIGKFFKNRKGDIVVVTIKQFEGVIFADIRQFFTGEDGVMRPTKKGVALSVRKLEDLAGLISKAIAKARELGLLATSESAP